jgi:hypothetical protein
MKAGFLAASLLLVLAGSARAADNELTARERREGWILLFDGRTLNGWMTSSRQPSKVPVEEGSINPHKSGGYMMIHEKPWSDFVLSLEYRISKGCNSGIFVRTWPLEPRPGRDVGFNGIEIAIDDTTGIGFHDPGAVYDLSRPTEQAQRPVGEWNRMIITCKGPLIEVELNGRKVNRVDLDRFTQPNRRPDGSEHKFDAAFKDHPREGYIGLQDHGSPLWFKNIKLKPLKP